MEISEFTLNIDLHYFMNDEDCHEMDATVHNKCEANLLHVLNHLGEIFDEDIQIDVSALQEGGIIDKLCIKFNSPAAKKMFLILYGALISHFIGISPSLDESQKQLNRAEIIKKIKGGDFTDDEVMFVIQGDPEILNRKNKYFEELSKESNVDKVSCSSYDSEDCYESTRPVTIEKKDFLRQIVKGYTETSDREYKGTSVLVVSPVLLRYSQAKWKGVFNGQDITFIIKDREFLEQVYAQEVSFISGTTLKCDLLVRTTTEYDAMGESKKKTLEREVYNITSWDDGSHFQNETKRYRRMKIEAAQPSLFSDCDFDN